MIAIAAWLVLAALVAYLVGAAANVGEVDHQPACVQDCHQGRDCTCAQSAGETPP